MFYPSINQNFGFLTPGEILGQITWGKILVQDPPTSLTPEKPILKTDFFEIFREILTNPSQTKL